MAQTDTKECPKCGDGNYREDEPCNECGFSGGCKY